MGGKKEAAKKGSVAGSFKAGKPLKDILPANSKQPREGQVARMEGDPEVQRSYDFEPLEMWPVWPGNDEAKTHDFKAGFEEDDEGNWTKFTEAETADGIGQVHLPPSFDYFTKGNPVWMRPKEYIKEIIYEKEVQKRRMEKKREYKLRKQTRKNSLMAMTHQTNSGDLEQQLKQETELELLNKTKQTINKDELVAEPKVIGFIERLETEAEVQKRKAAEQAAAQDKKAAKKAPAKGAPANDPADEPQIIQLPIDGSLDLSFAMPKYCKWVTSQFQFIRDRSIRDVDSGEAIWQRVYPQENGIPTISPTGKYWVKLRFMGKERRIEIDDRMPCSEKGMPILPRTCDHNEIWPQLLMKAILKVYSYKWYAANCQYDSEIGDGSIVYSLTGLIPETIAIQDLDQASNLFRKYLSDEYYFGKKAYLTAYCQNEFRPKFPSQTDPSLKTTGKNILHANVGSAKKEPGQWDETLSEPDSAASLASSSKLMLRKLKEAASLAISVTTGKKPQFGVKERSLTNIIPGFGYALMDVFENEFVDMESISKPPNQIVEENSSPFASPAKSRSKRKEGMSKEEYKKMRREQRRKEQEEREKREKEPPKQYSFVKIKTSIGKHPVINYLSTFTNDEIQEGKKHLINRWRRDPSKPIVQPYRSPSPIKKGYGEANRFKIDISEANQVSGQGNDPATNQDDAGPLDGTKTPSKKPDAKNILIPKTRAAGGIWLTQSDFPHAFQNIIVYHNLNKYSNCEVHQDIWEKATEPYISNDKEIYIKLELDPEAQEKVQQELKQNKHIGIVKPSQDDESADPEGVEENKEQEEGTGDEITGRDQEKLPGEKDQQRRQLDNIIIACAPYPTNKIHPVLPRYQTRIKQVDCEINGAAESGKCIDQNFKSYFEGVKFKVLDEMSNQQCIWLKPEFNCPQGATLWIACQLRKIYIKSKVEYLQEQKEFHLKQVTTEHLPLQAHKYQVLGKYEFNVTEDDTIINIKVDAPHDRFLLNYMRMKIVDRSPVIKDSEKDNTETEKVIVLNHMNLCDYKPKPNDGYGYVVTIEGIMPYNTNEGQIVIDTLSNKESFALQEIVQCEPLEYQDSYVPTKYGIIFKEKIVISPTDHTSASINIKLLKGNEEFSEIKDMKPKYFRVDVLDNGKPIFSQTGYNQITISNIMFRCNQGLPEPADDPNDGSEIKHNYVMQALFDLHEWPSGKSANDESADINWLIKVYSSETLALIKDTDKEDREKALKASWEADEPGRAEKAKLSRQKFLLRKKQRAGEQLTEEELEVLNEKRERVRKKDQEEVAAKGGGKGGKAPPAKGGKGAAPAKGAAAQEDDEPAAPVNYPKSDDHVNTEIKDFLEHFASSRKIIVTPRSQKDAYMRSEDEKAKILESFSDAMTAETSEFQKISEEREKMKESRQTEREEAFKDVEDERDGLKENLKKIIYEDRAGYRDMIEARKDKEIALLELVRLDKSDPNMVKTAIEQAEEVFVKPKYIKRGKKYLEYMEYVQEFETHIKNAVAEKNKDLLQALLERVEKESAALPNPVPIDAKILNDAKGNLAKMK